MDILTSRLLIFVIFFTSGYSAHAAFSDTESLVESCVHFEADSPDYSNGFCMGYIQAVHDTYELLVVSEVMKGGKVCFDGEMSASMFASFILDYLKAHPEYGPKVASGPILEAFAKTFPCR